MDIITVNIDQNVIRVSILCSRRQRITLLFKRVRLSSRNKTVCVLVWLALITLYISFRRERWLILQPLSFTWSFESDEYHLEEEDGLALSFPLQLFYNWSSVSSSLLGLSSRMIFFKRRRLPSPCMQTMRLLLRITRSGLGDWAPNRTRERNLLQHRAKSIGAIAMPLNLGVCIR